MTITSRLRQQALKLEPPVSRAARVRRDLRVPIRFSAALDRVTAPVTLLTADQRIYHDPDRLSAVILPTAASG